MVISQTSPGHLPENSDQPWEIRGQISFIKNTCSWRNLAQLKQVVMDLGPSRHLQSSKSIRKVPGALQQSPQKLRKVPTMSCTGGTSYMQCICIKQRYSGHHEYGPLMSRRHYEVHWYPPWVALCGDIRRSILRWLVRPPLLENSWNTNSTSAYFLSNANLCSIKVVWSDRVCILEPIHSFSGWLSADSWDA